MNRRYVLAHLVATPLASALLAPPLLAQATGEDTAYDALLARYVRVGADGLNRVDYARWHASGTDRAALKAYIAASVARKPSAMARGEAMAFWGNLYNALTLQVILDRYPVQSIRDIKSAGSWFDFKSYTGPWRETRVNVEGKALSLDMIEHEIMRPTFKDPRVHYVVNCASIGCPNLMPRAWHAATLEDDLVAAARAYINHPRGVTVLGNGSLRVSSIYKWFSVDFGGEDKHVIEHIRRYAQPALAARLAPDTRISEDTYDWSLNAVSP